MKEFIDKLISRLEEVKEKHQPTINGKTTMRDLEVYKMTIGYAKEIVNELAEEYINTSTISKMETVAKVKNVRTNADRIRSMTDEELGKAMFNFILNAASNPDFIMSPQEYTEWLQSEAE